MVSMMVPGDKAGVGYGDALGKAGETGQHGLGCTKRRQRRQQRIDYSG